MAYACCSEMDIPKKKRLKKPPNNPSDLVTNNTLVYEK